MTKFYGAIGYGETLETTPGKWEEVVTERLYFGEVLRNTRRLQAADKINDNVSVSNEISIVADPYAYDNFHKMRYIEFMGVKWKVANVDVQYPRLLLTLGDVYNGEPD